MGGLMRSVVRHFALGAVMAIAVFSLTSCSQSQIYAMDKVSGTYFAIPKGWNKIVKSDLKVFFLYIV